MTTDKKVKDIIDPLDILNEVEGVGKIEKWIDVSKDYKILITTINAEEEVEIFKACKNELGFGYLAKNKFEVLARAIKGINGNKFKYVEMEDGPEREIERERTIEEVEKRIKIWHDDIVSFAYAEWINMAGDAETYLKKIGIIVDLNTEEKLENLKSDLEEKVQVAEEETQILQKKGANELSEK